MQKKWKKILSGLIAAVLVFTTCSVGFSAFAQEDAVEKGNTSYAAEGPQTRAAAAVTPAPTQAQYQALADAMKNDYVKNATFELTKDASNTKEYQATDNTTGDLTKAFTLFSNIVNALVKNTETAKVNNDVESTYATIKDAMQNVMTPADFANYNVAAVLKSFFGADTPELALGKYFYCYVQINPVAGCVALLNEETLPSSFAKYTRLTITFKGNNVDGSVKALFNNAPSLYASTINPAKEFAAVANFFTTAFMATDIASMLDLELRQINDKGAKAYDTMAQYAPEVITKFMSEQDYANYEKAPAFIAKSRREAADRYVQKLAALDKQYGGDQKIPVDDWQFVLNEQADLKNLNTNLYNYITNEMKAEDAVKDAKDIYTALTKKFTAAISEAYCGLAKSVCDRYQAGDSFAFTPENIEAAQSGVTDMEACYKEISYSDKKLANVKEAYARHTAFKAAVESYTVDVLAYNKFINAAEGLASWFNGQTPKTITAESAGPIGELLGNLDGLYDALSAAKKQEAQVAAYKTQIDTLRAALTAYTNETNGNAFLTAAKELLPQFFDGATLKTVTMENYFTVNAAASKLESLYNKLTDAQKEDATIKSYGAQVAQMRAGLTAVVPEDLYKTAKPTYPEGMKDEDVTQLAAKLDAFLTGDAFVGLTGLSLSTLISDNLYNDAMMNTIASAVYPMLVDALGDMAGLASLIGIQVFPDGVSGLLTNEFASVKRALYQSGNDWSKVDWSNVSWNNISTRAEFIHALSCALEGIQPLLEVLLTSRDISLAKIYGNEGYEKVVLPLMEQLGCKNIASTAEFKSDATMEGYLSKILDPLLARVEEILASPITELTRLLPTLGYMANFDMIAGGVAELTKPLASMLNVSELLAGLGVNLSDLGGTINALLKDTGIVLPDINWANLAGRGTISKVDSVRESGTRVCITANAADTGMALMQYLVETLKANGNAIFGALGLTEGPVFDAVNALLLADTNQIIGALYQALTAGAIPDVNWDMSQFQWTKNNVSYPEGLTPERLEKFTTSLDALLNSLLPSIAGQSLPNLIQGALYQNAVIDSLAQALYGLLGNDSLAPVLAQLGIDVSIAGVAQQWEAKYPEAAAALEGKTAWSEVDFANVSWNVTGRESFANALAAALRPLNSVLGVLLCGDSLNILDLVTINGANGYQNAVLPLLRALSCENVLDAAEFQAAVEANPDAILTSILNPVLALVDKIAADPVATLIDLLPNLAYFLNNGGLTKALHALVLPVTNVTDPILPLMTDQDLFGFIFDLTGLALPLDLNDVEGTLIPTLNSVLETAGLALTLPAIDWGVLAGCGTLVDEMGNPANPSARAEATYRVQASRADATLTVLRYVVDVLQADGNAPVLKNLIMGLGDQGNLIWMIVEPLLTEDRDAVVMTLVDLLAPADDEPTPDQPGDNPQDNPGDNPGGDSNDKPDNSDTGDALFGTAGFLMLAAGAALVYSRKKRS